MSRKENLKELMVYMLYGTMTVVVNWGVYCLLEFFGLELNVCNAASWLASVLFAYVTNKFFVFKPTGKSFWREFGMFFSARLLTGVLELGLFPVLLQMDYHALFGIEGFVPKILVGTIVMILNYFFSKWIIFK